MTTGYQFYDRQQLIATRGIPGSGKSTWAKAWVAGGPRRAHVSRDDIRFQLWGVYFGGPVNEGVVSSVQQAMIISLLGSGYSVIVDNTHIGLGDLGGLSRLAKSKDVLFRVAQFDVPLETALERNAQRERVVPDEVIRRMHSKFNPNILPDEWRMF